MRLFYDSFDGEALAERLDTDFAAHVYFPSELELLFVSAGFVIREQYGDYEFAPVSRRSNFIVTVAARPATTAWLRIDNNDASVRTCIRQRLCLLNKR